MDRKTETDGAQGEIQRKRIVLGGRDPVSRSNMQIKNPVFECLLWDRCVLTLGHWTNAFAFTITAAG